MISQTYEGNLTEALMRYVRASRYLKTSATADIALHDKVREELGARLDSLCDKAHRSEITAADVLAAAIAHIPPRGQQTIRYYGLYSNKSRGLPRPGVAPTEPADEKQPAPKPPIVPPPPKVTARAMRPLWRDLIFRVWGADPLQCPCCKSTMKVVDTFFRPGEIQFFLRLQGLWEGVIDIPSPPDPPFEPIEPPWQAIREWIPDADAEQEFDLFEQRPDSGMPVEIPREDGSILVLGSD